MDLCLKKLLNSSYIEQEPGGVRVAKKCNNFLVDNDVVCTSLFIKTKVCRASGGGCGTQGHESAMPKLT